MRPHRLLVASPSFARGKQFVSLPPFVGLLASPAYKAPENTVVRQIRGKSFGVSDYTCVFGAYEEGITAARHVAPGLLECPIPPAPVNETDGAPVAGMTSLRIISEVGFHSNRLQFTFFISPTLLGLVPTFGSTDGGTRVIVVGIGFAKLGGGVGCSFGGVETRGEVLSTTEVACTSPAAAVGGFAVGDDDDARHLVPVLVTMNGLHYVAGLDEQSSGTQVAFEYADVPVISFISPTTGPPDLHGETARYLKVHGAHFRGTAGLACRFGTLLTEAVFLSPSEIECSIPALSSATGDAPTVAVTANGVDFSRQGPPSTTFTYVASPELLGISPALGPSIGGTTVTVIGSNFNTATAMSSEHASLICRFELEDPPTSSSNDDAGASGELTHTRLWHVSATIESDSAATCVSPAVVDSIAAASGTGYASVHVSSDGGSSFSVLAARFFFYPEILVSTATPATMPASEGGDLLVAGQGFLPGEGLLLCQYEATAAVSFQTDGNASTSTAVALWLSPELVRCALPAFDVERGTSSTLGVRVTNNGIDLSPSAAALLVYSPPDLLEMTPATGPRTGGTPIILAIDGWSLPVTNTSFDVKCQWGEAVITQGELSYATPDAEQATPLFVSCVSPSMTETVSSAGDRESEVSDGSGIVEVNLQVDGQQVSASGAGLPFTYYDVPSLHEISPIAGGQLGGTEVVMKGSGFAFGAPGNAGSGQVVCKFGENGVVFAAVVSDSELRCRSPAFGGGEFAAVTGASVDMEVSMNGGVDYVWPSSATFHYLPIASTTGETEHELRTRDEMCYYLSPEGSRLTAFTSKTCARDR